MLLFLSYQVLIYKLCAVLWYIFIASRFKTLNMKLFHVMDLIAQKEAQKMRRTTWREKFSVC